MKYGFYDCSRNVLGINVDSGKLRKNEFWAVDDVSFELKRGDVLGLIGKNGSGKSTMLKMLNGIYMPDKGKIEINGKVGALIEVGAGFHPLLTGRENIYINGSILGMSKKEIDEKFDAIVEFADIGDFIDSPVRTYSSGMYVRLGFSVAVHSEPEILLVDEVLAVGDLGFQAKCLNKIGEMKGKGTSIILVSHQMNTISNFADRAILLHNSKMIYNGDISEAIQLYKNIFNEKIIDNESIDKIVTATNDFKVSDVKFVPSGKLNPGDDFSIQLEYESTTDLQNIDVELALIKDSNFSKDYYRSTNLLFNKQINIERGKGTFKITIKNIPINDSKLKLSIAIWKHRRSEILFWWRDINLNFNLVPLCLGENLLNVEYEIISHSQAKALNHQ
jgi:lipopolysaccharide transport system ATP-binding protein